MAANAGGSKLSQIRAENAAKEARRSGLVPPERDAQGKPINPHIPDFMAKAPWYLSSGGEQKPGLEHHKAQRDLLVQFDSSADKLKERYQRGKVGPAASKYRAGACTNCGAMTHAAKDCLERPRKIGAKWTGKAIAADEIVLQDRKENYDSKRDRWDGYDPSSHRAVVDEHEAIEAARRRAREEALDKTTDMGAVKKVAKAGKTKKKEDDEFGSSDDSDEEDEEKYAEAADQAGAGIDTNNRISVRNLRIREDTAKYLRTDVNTDTAHYDPKSRSLRGIPDAEGVVPEGDVFAGASFTRGEAADAQAQQLFAWQASQRGQDLDMHANPTQAAIVHRQYLEKKAEMKGETSQSMLDKYGGKEYLHKAPKELLAGQTEDYVEYSRTGQVIKGQERAKAKSKYDEDVYPGNHKSVWGSYWREGRWGYACCHAFIRQAYCAGQAGIEAEREEAAGRLLTGNNAAFGVPDRSVSLADQHAADFKGKRKAIEDDDSEPASKRRVGEDEVDKRMHPDRLKSAMDAERKQKRDGYESSRSTNGFGQRDVTEEEMEAHRRMRDQYEDPMANVKDDELLPMT